MDVSWRFSRSLVSSSLSTRSGLVLLLSKLHCLRYGLVGAYMVPAVRSSALILS